MTELPGDAYRVYVDMTSPKLNGQVERLYWQGPGSRTILGASEQHRESAAQFPDRHAARKAFAAWLATSPFGESMLAKLGYEFVPATIEHLPLFPDPKENQ